MRLNTSSNRVMENRNHSKNGVNLKNRMSRRDFYMPRLLCVIIVFTMSNASNIKAQINLVHTLSVTGSTYFVSWDDNINLYTRINPSNYTVNSTEYTIYLYNFDFSLYKTISLTLESLSVSGQFKSVHYSKHIFNHDDKIEILLEQDNRLRLFNEDGNLLYDFGTLMYSNIAWNTQIFKYQGFYYLKINRNTQINGKMSYTEETYKLSEISDYSAIENVNTNIELIQPFPNPAKTTINLPYKLEQGQTSTMYIYNVSGQLMEEKQIDSVFDKILLDVSNYKSGIYFYKVNKITNKFIVGK